MLAALTMSCMSLAGAVHGVSFEAAAGGFGAVGPLLGRGATALLSGGPAVDARFLVLDEQLVIDASLRGGLTVFGVDLARARPTSSFAIGQLTVEAACIVGWRFRVGDGALLVLGAGPWAAFVPADGGDTISDREVLGVDPSVRVELVTPPPLHFELRLDVPVGAAGLSGPGYVGGELTLAMSYALF